VLCPLALRQTSLNIPVFGWLTGHGSPKPRLEVELKSTLLLLVSLFLSVVFTTIALIIIVFGTASSAGTGGITAVAGGFSFSLLLILLAAFLLSSVGIFLMLRKFVERKR